MVAAGGGGATASGLAQGVALEFNPVCGVNDAVQDRFGISGIPDRAMPVGQRDLGGQDDRSAVMAIIDNLHQIPALGALSSLIPQSSINVELNISR